MALIPCAECAKQISDKATACPHCGAPVAPSRLEREQYEAVFPTAKKPASMPMWAQVVVGLIGAYILFSCTSGMGGGKNTGSKAAASGFDWNDALVMCQTTIKGASRDPEKADVPYVANQGSGDEFYFAWGASTRMARLRNGLGLEFAASAACTVSKSQKRITSLSIDGKTII